MRHGFSILLPEVDTVWVFGYLLNLSYISAVLEEYRCLHLILDMSLKPNEGTSSVNNTKDREVTLEAIQSGCYFPLLYAAVHTLVYRG